jgi:hypothetical protein
MRLAVLLPSALSVLSSLCLAAPVHPHDIQSEQTESLKPYREVRSQAGVLRLYGNAITAFDHRAQYRRRKDAAHRDRTRDASNEGEMAWPSQRQAEHPVIDAGPSFTRTGGRPKAEAGMVALEGPAGANSGREAAEEIWNRSVIDKKRQASKARKLLENRWDEISLLEQNGIDFTAPIKKIERTARGMSLMPTMNELACTKNISWCIEQRRGEEAQREFKRLRRNHVQRMGRNGLEGRLPGRPPKVRLDVQQQQ